MDIISPTGLSRSRVFNAFSWVSSFLIVFNSIALPFFFVTKSAYAVDPVFPIKINEVASNESSGSDWIEFFNTSGSELDIVGYCLGNSTGSSGWKYTFPLGTKVPANGFLAMDESQFGGGGFYFGAFTAALFSPGCTSVLNSASSSGVGSHHSWGAQTDGSDTFIEFSTTTKGVSNVPDTTPPAVPTHTSPTHNSYINNTSSLIVDWESVTDSSSPVYYIYHAALNGTVNGSNGEFVSPIYTSSHLSDSQISAGGTADGVYYWQVKSCDSLNNCSNWSTPWKLTVDTVKPTDPDGDSFVSTTHNVNEPSNNRTITVTWSDSASDTSGIAGYSVLFSEDSTALPDTIRELDYPATSYTETVPSDGSWYFSLRTEDLAGNWTSTVRMGPFVIDATPPIFPGNPGWGQGIPPSGYQGDGSGIDNYKACGSIVKNDGSYRGLWGEATDPLGPVTYQRQLYKDDAFLPQVNSSQNYTDEFTPGGSEVPDGEYYVRVRALDLLGNATIDDATWSDTATYTSWCQLTVDTAAPSDNPSGFSSVPDINTFSNVNNVFVSWTNPGLDVTSGVDGYSYSFSPNTPELPIDIKVIEGSDTSVTSDMLSDGYWYFNIRTVDKAGNWTTSSTDYGPFIIETLPPTVSITYPLNPFYGPQSWTGSFEGTASDELDGSGLNRVEVQLGSDGWTTANGTDIWNLSYSSFSEGSYTVYARAFDIAGNLSGEDQKYFVWDQTNPQTLISLSSPNYSTGGVTYITEATDFSLTPSDPGISPSGIDKTYYKIDGDLGGLETEYLSPFTLSGYDTGNHTIEYWSVDVAGNLEDHNSVDVNNEKPYLDKDAPVSAISFPEDGKVYSPTTWIGGNITGTADDNSGSGVLGVGVTIYKVADGTYWDGAAFIGPMDSWTYNWIPDTTGDYLITAEAEDNLNQETSSSSVSFSFDNEPPAVPSLTSPADGSFIKPADAILNWEDVTDPQGHGPVTYNFKSQLTGSSLYGPVSTGTDSYYNATAYAEGEYLWQVQACDVLENCSDWSGAWIVTIDGTNPTDPSGFSSTPVITTPTRDNTVQVNWSTLGADTLSGVDGYSYSFTQTKDETPNDIKDIEESVNSVTSGTLADGTWYFHIRTIDNAGNWTATAHYGPFVIDTTRPSAPNPISPVDGYAIKSVAFNQIWETISDATQYRYQSCNTDPGDSGGTCSSVKSTSTYTGTTKSVGAGQPNSHFWWRVQAKDSAGNWSLYGPAYELIIDKSAPTIVLNSYLLDPTNTNTPTFSGTSADVYDAGVQKVEYRIVNNGGTEVVAWTDASGTTSYSFTPTALGEGLFTFYTRATDRAGNVSAIASDILTIDTVLPLDPIISSSSHSISTWSTDNTIDVSWTGADGTGTAVAGYSILWDQFSSTLPGGTVNTTLTSASSPTLSDNSNYYFHLRTQDAAGNWSAGVTFGPLFIDTTAPVAFNLATPTDGEKIKDATPLLDWENSSDTGSGLAGYEVYLDELKISGLSLLNESAFAVTGNLIDGDHSWFIKAFDNVGLSTQSVTWTFTIDTVIPSSIIVTPTNNGTDTIVYTNSWDGVVAGTASDNLGGVGLSKVQISIQRDSDDSYWNGESWSGSEIEILLNTESTDGFANWSYSLSNPLFDETYIVKSHATDLAGNIENSYKITIVYDKTIPQVALTIDPVNPDGDNSWYVSKPKITLTATDSNFEQIEYQLNSQTGIWLLYLSAVTIEEGTHKFYYHALDLAGNVSETGLKNVKVDLTRPEDVADLRAEAGDEEVTLEWDASPSDDIDHYTIYKSEDKNFIPNPETELAEVSDGTRSYDDTKVDNDTKYYYYIIAFDTAGNTSDAKGVSATPSVESPETETLPTLPITQGTVEGVQTESGEGTKTGEEGTINGGNSGEVKGEETEEQGIEQGDEEGEDGKGGVLGIIDKFWWLLLFFIPFSFALWYRKKG